MKRAFTAPLFVVILLVLSLHSAPSAQAAIILTLDNPDQTIAAPTSGVTDLIFTGTLSIPAGFSWDTIGVLFPHQATGELLFASLRQPPADYDAANNGGTLTGELFRIHVPAGATPGLYNLDSTLAAPSTFHVHALGANENQENASAPYSVRVTSPAAVPEPGTLALTGLGMLGMGVWLRRRKKSG